MAIDKERASKIGKSNVSTSKSHERRLARLLTEWSGVEFRRRRVEGRDSTVVERESTADVIPVTGRIWFSIEAKKGKGFSLDAMLNNPGGCLFTEWWHQTCYDAEILTGVLKQEYLPLLFFKPQPAFDWLAVDQTAFKQQKLKPRDGSDRADIWFTHLAYDPYAAFGPITMDTSHSKKHPVMVSLQLKPVYLVRWRDFAANILPTSMFAQI